MGDLRSHGASGFGSSQEPTQPMRYGSAEWKAKVLDGHAAIEWVIKIADEDDADAIWFLRCVKDGSVVKDLEWSEYRYWATGAHEPDTETEESSP